MIIIKKYPTVKSVKFNNYCPSIGNKLSKKITVNINETVKLSKIIDTTIFLSY